jgi:hypothetical protein
MGGWDEAKSRPPNEQEMALTIQVLEETLAKGDTGWADPRPTAYGASVRRDCDGTIVNRIVLTS